MPKSIRYHRDSIIRRLTRRRHFPLLVQRRGAKFLLDPRNWIDAQLAAGFPFEDAQIEFARAVVEREQRNLVVDIGANIGVYTVLLGALPGVEKVLAFEPVRRNFNQLLANVFANRLDSKVDAHRLALGEASEEKIIHVDPNHTGISRFGKSAVEGNHHYEFSHEEVVSVRPFDDIASLECSPGGSPDSYRAFAKIDVEGHAGAVLRGMRKFLATNDVVLQVELLPSEQDDVIRLLDSMGYAPTQTFGRDRYFRRK
jgi:FkbM family methyltransferase